MFDESASPGRRPAATAALTARTIGGLLMRLCASETWQLGALRAEDALLLASSTGDVPDAGALRREVRMQRLAGSVLPHAGLTRAPEHERTLCAVAGTYGGDVVVLRFTREPGGRPYLARDAAHLMPFLEVHGDTLLAALFGSGTSVALVERRLSPIQLIVADDGSLLSWPDRDGEPPPLAAALLPLGHRVSPLLAPFVAELLARHAAGSRALATVLPFAVLRLLPLHGRGAQPAFLVSLEWLRGHASLTAAAERYAISRRELQVVSAMLRGDKVAEIAEQLSISDSTVIFHLKRLLKKTGARNRPELAAKMLDYESAGGAAAASSS